MEKAPTCIGRVRHVLGSQVTVQLDPELAGVAPIFRGELQSIGQIGSLVKIPQGLIDVLATVTLVGIAELAQPEQASGRTEHAGERWLQVQLLGEIDHATRSFRRGVTTYPGLDDEVHFTLSKDLETVYPAPGESAIRLGSLASSTTTPVCLDASRLVTRHSAIVGSTGAGKSSAVATLVQAFADGSWPSANVVVVDTHGEYTEAFGANARVSGGTSAGAELLRVPFWALPAAEIIRAFTGTSPGQTTLKAFEAAVQQARIEFLASCAWLAVDASTVTADTPIPFDIRQVWYGLDRENRETRTVKSDPATECLVAEGDPATLRSAEFEPYAPAGGAPHQAPNFGIYGSTPELLRIGLKDPRLRFLLEPEVNTITSDPLEECLRDWLGQEKPVSVIDFTGVPSDTVDVAVGVMLQLIFEVAIRTRSDEPGIGRPRPVLLVLEEAHRYLSDSSAAMARASVNRIAREGRKYGVGLMLVTQRPSELPDTALSQCGTLIALRLSNSADQSKVRQALPDDIAGLAEVLASLRTGEAIVSGESVILPSRVVVASPQPAPNAEDASLRAWRGDATMPEVEAAIERWRNT